MTCDALNELIVSLETSGYEMFWKYDSQFFMLFYDRFQDMPYTDIPDIAFMFMEINNWQGMSLRCGVWQYYESGAFSKGKFERVLSFLKAKNEEEMASVYAYGIHDYANEEYQENYNYPEEWLVQSIKIDKWISDNEVYLYKWMYCLILGHKSEILKLCAQ